MLAPRQPADASQICEIYNHYVRETVITFEETPVAVGEMERRIREVTERFPWLVWKDQGSIVGYAYATGWKPRSAYRHSVETTVYVSPAAPRRGIGTRLYQAILDELRQRNVHCAMAGIALPNAASVALHEKLGFRQVGEFREIGWKFERWIDVGYWQLLL